MMKIVDYYIVFSDFSDSIEPPVKAMIEGGWQPQGGPIVLVGENDRLVQAMVKYEEAGNAED